ncbi:hypothetical protein SAMN03080615_00062 [Amphritea atlantica]|uniref:Uncharacterized protein n=2 Tax=Amphritea atlantica TaxID=355243 RepID=A0A1H9CMI9_9GAMM|nr:hypothetical protein SAMN03080615_00062 [Amphritea atlantica]
MVYASQLAKTLGGNWTIEFPDDEREWPDLLVHDGVQQFGLEVREITKDKETKKGSIRRASEGRNNQIIQKLADSYYQQTSIPIKVGILGNIDNETVILESLLQFSIESKEWDNIRIDTNKNSIIYATHLPEEIGIYKRWEYVDDRVGWVREIDSEFLAPFIIEKEKKIPKYKIHLDDIRLLLVADPTYSSGQLLFTDNKIDIESEFNEIYFLVYPNEVHRANS